MNGMKKILLLFLLGTFLLPLTACGTKEGISIRELNELNIVMVTGIDYDLKTGEYIISIQSVKPATSKGGGISKESVYTAKASGKTIMEASKNLRAVTSGKLIWFHSKSFIFGNDLIQNKDLKEVVDFLVRNREVRLTAWVLTTNKQAVDIITAKPNSEVTLGDELQGIVNNQSEWGKGTVLTLKDLVNLYENPHQAFVTGQIIQKEGMKKGKKVVAIEGATAIYHRRYLMELTPDEVIPLQLIKKVSKREPEIIYSIPLHQGSNSSETNTAVKGVVNKRTDKVVIENGLPTININLSMDATVMETGTNESLRDEETYKDILREVSSQIRIRTEELIYKAQKEKKADIFGFSGVIHRQEKKYWREHEKDWDTIYPKMPIHLTVDWNMVRNGMITHIRQGEQK